MQPKSPVDLSSTQNAKSCAASGICNSLEL